MRPYDLRELLRAPRVGVERRDVPCDLLRRLADGFADVPAVPVLLPGFPRPPDLPVRPDDRPDAGEPGLDRVLDAEHLRLADLQPPPVQLFSGPPEAKIMGKLQAQSPPKYDIMYVKSSLTTITAQSILRWAPL